MRIAQIAPPWYTVPPSGYGGIEWVVSLLADGLTARGHEVVLYAPPGSRTDATLVSCVDEPLGGRLVASAPHETRYALEVYADLAEREVDLVHDHAGFVSVAVGATRGVPVVHTLHGQFTDVTAGVYRRVSPPVAVVAISEAQRAMCPDLAYAGTVYNGIPLDRYPFSAEKEDFLLFLGRANPDKGPETAIEVARRLGMPLRMAVKIAEDVEVEFWKGVVEPLLGSDIEVLGEIAHDEKAALLARARAVLFPITWPEPFGLVMAEANACGTPVVAFRHGAAPEVLAHGETGFVVDTIEEMCDAVRRAGEIDPHACRRRVEERFSADVMVRGYEQAYERVLAER